MLQLSLLGVILLGCLIYPAASLATNWHSVAATDDRSQEQFVDPDSIQVVAAGQVRVNSYYLDHRSGQTVTTTYLTDYDCYGHRFRDVEYEGPVGQASWQPVEPDPLNAAAMVYACAQAGYDLSPPAAAQN